MFFLLRFQGKAKPVCTLAQQRLTSYPLLRIPRRGRSRVTRRSISVSPGLGLFRDCRLRYTEFFICCLKKIQQLLWCSKCPDRWNSPLIQTTGNQWRVWICLADLRIREISSLAVRGQRNSRIKGCFFCFCFFPPDAATVWLNCKYSSYGNQVMIIDCNTATSLKFCCWEGQGLSLDL